MSISLVRVLLVSDWTLLRQGLVSILSGMAGVEIVGEASDVQSAVKLAGFPRADVILLTLTQPGIQPIKDIHCLTAARPGTSVLVLGGPHSDEQLLQAVNAGAVGCLRSDAQSMDVARAIHAIHRGEAWVTHAVAMKIFRDIQHPGNVLSAAGSSRGLRECRQIATPHADKLLLRVPTEC